MERGIPSPPASPTPHLDHRLPRHKTDTTNHTQTQVPPHGAQIWLSPSPVALIQGLADEQGRRGGAPACALQHGLLQHRFSPARAP